MIRPAGTTPSRIAIVVDDRERGSAIPEMLDSHGDFDVAIRRLAVGDYFVDERFLFERKTLRDLVVSIQSGRLFKQALRLTEMDGFQPALLLEGTSRQLRADGMRWEAIQGALVTMSLFIGLPILRTRTPEETVKTLGYVARQGRSVARGALPRRGRRAKHRSGHPYGAIVI